MKKVVFLLLLVVSLYPFAGKAQQNCTLTLSGVVQEASCAGGMDASIQLQLSGGVAPYTYQWASGQNTANITQLTEGVYSVTVSDSHGCKSSSEFKVKTSNTVPLKLNVSRQASNNQREVLQVQFAGGKKPYAMTVKKISEGYRAPTVPYTGQALDKGTYILEAFTEAGCSVIEKVTVGAN